MTREEKKTTEEIVTVVRTGDAKHAILLQPSKPSMEDQCMTLTSSAGPTHMHKTIQ
jgi:hypothetical protein